jgi:hypothetical protein
MPIKPKKNPVTKLIGAGVKAAAKAAGKKPSLKAAQKAKPLATPKSGVKVIKKREGGLENRGTKLPKEKKIERNQRYINSKRFDRAEARYEDSVNGYPQGPGSEYGGSRGLSIKKENRERSVFPTVSKVNKKGEPLTKKNVIRIDSQRNLKKKAK